MIAATRRPNTSATHSTARLRRHTTGGSLAAYEAAKAAWDAAHPDADWREREAAMRQLAASLGV